VNALLSRKGMTKKLRKIFNLVRFVSVKWASSNLSGIKRQTGYRFMDSQPDAGGAESCWRRLLL
jgi:hypothetical protein